MVILGIDHGCFGSFDVPNVLYVFSSSNDLIDVGQLMGNCSVQFTCYGCLIEDRPPDKLIKDCMDGQLFALDLTPQQISLFATFCSFF